MPHEVGQSWETFDAMTRSDPILRFTMSSTQTDQLKYFSLFARERDRILQEQSFSVTGAHE